MTIADIHDMYKCRLMNAFACVLVYECSCVSVCVCKYYNDGGMQVIFFLLMFKGSYEMPCIDTVEDVDKFEIQVLVMM